MALRSRIARCNGPDWGYRFTCRSPACPGCRDRYIAKQRREAEKRFAGTSNEHMAMLSINLGAVRSAYGIGGVMDKARRDLRNLWDRQRKDSPFWSPAELIVWLETDAVALEDYPRLGPDKQEQIAEFMNVYDGMTGVVWLPSLHGVMKLGPGLDIGLARAAFERQWKGHRRVDLRPFFETRPMVVNLGEVINYSLKHTCTTEFYDPETGEVRPEEWETRWLGEYYSWLYGFSRGFQSTRIKINPSRPCVSSVVDDENIDIEPLPNVCSFSVFDMDSYYWY